MPANERSELHWYLYVDDTFAKWKVRMTEEFGDINDADFFDPPNPRFDDVPDFPRESARMRYMRVEVQDVLNSAGVFHGRGRYRSIPLLNPVDASTLIGRSIPYQDIRLRVVSITGEKLPAIAGDIQNSF